MITSDKNVGRKFNIKKMSARRQITLLMRNDYHRCAGAGAFIRKYSTCRRFSGRFHVPPWRVYHEDQGTLAGKEQRGIHQLFITSLLKEEHDVQGGRFENWTHSSAEGRAKWSADVRKWTESTLCLWHWRTLEIVCFVITTVMWTFHSLKCTCGRSRKSNGTFYVPVSWLTGRFYVTLWVTAQLRNLNAGMKSPFAGDEKPNEDVFVPVS